MQVSRSSTTENVMNKRRVVRIEAKPGQAVAARDALLELQRATVTEPGCAEFGFFQGLGDEHRFLLVEDFVDQAALDLHMAAPYTQTFFSRELVAGIAPIQKDWMG
jgi:quinol monooxygenase YgiN